MQLYNSHDKPINECNINDEKNDTHFYVNDKKIYEEYQKDSEDAKIVSFATGTCLLLFLCIFTLNLQSSGWTLGNLMIFILLLIFLILSGVVLDKWLSSFVLLQKMKSDGVPCYIEKNSDRKVYCSQF